MNMYSSWLLILLVIVSGTFGLTLSDDKPEITAIDLTTNESFLDFIDYVKTYYLGINEEITSATMDGTTLTITIDISKTDLHDGMYTFTDIAQIMAYNIADSILMYPELDIYWDYITVDVSQVGSVTFSKEDIPDTKYGSYFENGRWNTY